MPNAVGGMRGIRTSDTRRWATTKRRVSSLKRTRPPTGYTAGDLILGTVVGFVAALLVGLVAMILVMLLLPSSSRIIPWIQEGIPIVCIMAGLAAGGRVVDARSAERKRRFVDRRTGALQRRRCPECDYDLRGTIEPRCPECGEAFTAQEWKLTTSGASPEL
jgi:hypothetical protein